MPTIQGQEFQHGTIDLKIAAAGGAPIASVTFTKIDGKNAAPKKPVQDSQGQVKSFTVDGQVITANCSMLFSEYRYIRSQLLQQNPQLGILQIVMDWTITFGNQLSNLRTDTWNGVMFQEDPFSSQNDQNALVVDLPLFVQAMKPDGVASIIYRPY
jgi:hypothetical protein